MRVKKSLLAIALVLLMLLNVFLVGCDKEEEPSYSSSTITQSSQEPSSSEKPNEKPPVEEPPVEEGTDLKSSVDALLTSKKKLSFDANGNFKVLVLADVHAGGALPEVVQTNIKTLVDRENPQLVIFTGDNTICGNETSLRAAISSMVGYIEEKQIPWCHVYGNHDHEGGMSKVVMQPIFESYDYCVSKWGDAELFGIGNYVLPVYKHNSDEVGFLVWCLDSGNYISNSDKTNLLPTQNPYEGYPGSNYDYIKPDQISWYYNSSLLLESYFGKKLNSIMAFHIPLQENYYAWQNRNSITSWDGSLQESICASLVNSGLFNALVARGDVRAVVTGHDHKNDYMLETCGIKLCASPNVGTNTYYDVNQQGGRVFTINSSTPLDVKTHVQYIIERQIIDTDSFEVIPDGTTISDFESADGLEVTSTKYASTETDESHIAKITEGKGVDGSHALELGRTEFKSNHTFDNTAVKWSLSKAGKLGENKYLVVWMDFSTFSTGSEFRKACFGLVDEKGNVYRTDDHDTASPFYYLADGASEWVEMSHGSDGCFGADQSSPMKGKKGYFAFPVEYMQNGASKISQSAVVTNVYMYFCYAYGAKLVNFYVDNAILTKDYTLINK
ncbi:MAG: metallophosphoesterase [Clostridia bacterium]|nr:metallophosphoesterase [Clostridia bacterium]